MKSLLRAVRPTARDQAPQTRRSHLTPAIALLASAMVLALATSAAAAPYSDSPTQVPVGYTAPRNDGLGVHPGAIKHVWLIIMENKSYDATFTGLNGNSYLWQTLPSQGALLTNYYGTGHSSEDNYLSMVSGQAPISDDQSDCPNYTNLAGNIDTSGSLSANPNFGQFRSAAGPNAPIGDNGCVYPESSSNQSADNPSNTVETIFNQLDAAGKSWKVYAQDLYGDDNGDGAVTANGNNETVGHSAGAQYCGAPYNQPGPTPSSSQASSVDPNPGSAVSYDQYVPKHNPTPWFQTVLQSGDCATHVAPVLGANDQLSKDLANRRTTPNLSVIVPNNCSDAHDAVCAGNNLSGGFGTGADSQVANAPINNTGGLYAGDLFLKKVIPEIESSAAFADGGLIDVTFDEAFPPFTWQNSFVNSTLLPSTAFGAITTDEAGETLYGRSVNWEPQGPNVPINYSSTGQVLTPGAGFGSSLDRPSSTTAVPGATVACSSGTTQSNGWVLPPSDGCILMGASTTPGASGSMSGTLSTGGDGNLLITIPDTSKSNPISIKDEGRRITFSDAGDASQESTDGGYFVADVSNTFDPSYSTNSSTSPDHFTFELVKSNGAPVTSVPDEGSESFTLGAQTAATDPLYDAYDPTLGGGDTGSVLISPYIKPGTVSNTYYNHYALLRTLEDIFQVDRTQRGKAAPMTTQGGIDGKGHLGYAAQPGLAPFGADVFTNAHLSGWDDSQRHSRTADRRAAARPAARAMCVVPDVRGYALAEARAIIRAAQCRVGSITGNRSSVVREESITVGRHEAARKAISLTFKK